MSKTSVSPEELTRRLREKGVDEEKIETLIGNLIKAREMGDMPDFEGISLMAAKLKAEERIKYRHAPKRRFEVECVYTVVVKGLVEVPVPRIQWSIDNQVEQNYDLVENGHKTEEELREEFLETETESEVRSEAYDQFHPRGDHEEDSFWVREFKEIAPPGA